jgi:hypothetical protein
MLKLEFVPSWKPFRFKVAPSPLVAVNQGRKLDITASVPPRG